MLDKITRHGGSRGRPAIGYNDATVGKKFRKVSIAWRPDQLDAINRRVVRNHTTFGHEARRLLDMALAIDHLEDGRARYASEGPFTFLDVMR